MPVDVNEVVAVCADLADEKNLRVTVQEALRGGLIAGATTVAGGLLLGPVGLAVGGAIGGAAAYANAQGKFKPVSTVLREMEPEKKKILYDRVQRIISGITIEDGIALLALIHSSDPMQAEFMCAVKSLVQDQLKMELIDGL
ncbi:protein C19orf12 homolog [Lingula anatina]|uniref:Protein C19orf12 homolog n=1 Tax=Lingula anatina TaxID=7574 RepID=A0A1S3K1C0_LINAN|nr:protein C19orf12 homolog [Lingula anatina]|eukprot:XP_013416425.1 protein C19orf12 homolog [Lingula anatina]